MNKQEMEESVLLPSPVLPRLDRLDRILQLLEEKHNLSERNLSNPLIQKVNQEDDKCKTLSSALDEVQRKGTLMERLAVLENRVLQLSLEMDEGNTSMSSSSTVPSAEKLGHGFTFANSTGSGWQDENEVVTHQGGQIPVAEQDQDQDSTGIACDAEKKGRKNDRRQSKKGYKKWLGWFHLGCN